MIKNIKKIVGFLCSAAFCTAIAVGMPQMAKAAEVTIDETNFPDEIFRDYVSSKFDKDGNGTLSEVEIANAKEINVQLYRNITSLEGIEHFTALTHLDCGVNDLTVLDVSKNTALTHLDCYGNELTALDISKNTALTFLFCGYNQLTALDVSKNTVLTYLNCRINKLTALDVSKNTALTHLECDTNQLADLDVSKNTALTFLQCFNNPLTTLDVGKNTALTSLDCRINKLAALDLSKNTALTDLHCGDNQLTDLDLSKNTALTFLQCGGNQLTDIDLSKNIALTDLIFFEDKLTTLDLSHNTALTYLICGYRQLTELRLNSQTYDKLLLNKEDLHYDYDGDCDNVILSDLKNITEIKTENEEYGTISLLKVLDITKPATYKVNGKDFTIIYTDTVKEPTPSVSPIDNFVPANCDKLFYDYNYTSPVSGSAVVIYGNGSNLTVDGKKVDNKIFTAYTDILASYKYTVNDNGVVKPSIGKVIVGITKSNVKPEVNDKNKITDTSASKIARATIKNGQVKVTALGKEGGLVYLWIIDTGNKGVYECCPINVQLAPKKLEVQDASGSKFKNTKLENGKTLDVCVAGLVDSTKTNDCTYTATVDPEYQNYITVTPIAGSTYKFTITATGMNNNKNTKAAVTFKCDQNGKKVKFSLTITKPTGL